MVDPNELQRQLAEAQSEMERLKDQMPALGETAETLERMAETLDDPGERVRVGLVAAQARNSEIHGRMLTDIMQRLMNVEPPWSC